jgi:hypothetical protein
MGGQLEADQRESEESEHEYGADRLGVEPRHPSTARRPQQRVDRRHEQRHARLSTSQSPTKTATGGSPAWEADGRRPAVPNSAVSGAPTTGVPA